MFKNKFDIYKPLNRRIFLQLAVACQVAFTTPLAAQELQIKQSTEMIASMAGVSGRKSIVLMDALTGKVLDDFNGSEPLPPASVTKVATALYALDALGPDTKLKTQVLATGPIQGGVLKGDLILVGSGDPRLDSDALGALAEQLKARGLKTVDGNFYVYPGALPYQRQIDPDQLDHVGYNPSVEGINLNFNRVSFKWKLGAEGYDLSFVAEARKYAPKVNGMSINLKKRDLPVFSYRSSNGKDHWTVAKSALGKAGSRWLPVRQPADYAGEVFRAVAAINGIRVPLHKISKTVTSGTVVAVWESATVRSTIKTMIKYSTNMTAESLGMLATARQGKSVNSLRASASNMSKWVEATYGVRGARFVDHSGLSADNRVSAIETARLLVNAKWNGPLRPIMKEISLRNTKWQKAPVHNTKIVVKTGTLDFASALAGYITSPNGRKLVFAILTSDLNKRSKIARKDRERPPGARTWARKSRIMQHRLIRYWVQKYGA